MTDGLCCFLLEKRPFALDVDLVTEVVAVDEILPVPGSPSFVLGLFSLRGSPVAVVDLGDILGFGAPAPKKTSTVLVVKRDELTAAFLIDRMVDVFRSDRGTITAVAAHEHPAVSCFFTAGEGASPGVITVLDADYLIRRLRARSSRKNGAAS
jgi:purine-binding chemotaxis protein CheW